MTIVQIGTNKGNDDVTEIVNKYKNEIDQLILVEPLTVHHSSIKYCYRDFPQAIVESSCIVDDPLLKEVSFYYHKEDGPGYEVASTNKEHILKHLIYNPKLTKDGIVEQKTPCITISNLLDKYYLKEIDLLYIDAEGFDDKIIYSIDFNKYYIKKIVYESIHIDKDTLDRYLETKGYTITSNYGHNGWSTLASFIVKSSLSNKVIIECGSWYGKSSRAIGDNLPKGAVLYCVDHWRGSKAERDNHHQSASWEDGDHDYLKFYNNTSDLIDKGKIIPLRLSSVNAAKLLISKGVKANMIFIDAGHTYEEVKEDIKAWLPLLKEGGIICGHDYYYPDAMWPHVAGVKKAVNEKFGNKVKQAPNTSIWYVDNWDYITYKGVIVDLSEKPKRPPCVFDCFPFNNELDILERRFETLYNHVDRFIIVEAMETHAGKPKDLVFNNNLDRFAKYLNKVTYGPCVIEKFPDFQGSVTDQSWARERFQRDNIMKGLGDCQDDDIVIISDCDEIPDTNQIAFYKTISENVDLATLPMELYYFNEHTRAKDLWLEAKITTYGKLKVVGPCGARYTKPSYILNGVGYGKHLSYFGGVDTIIKKIEDTAHQEYNQPQYKDKAVIFQRILRGEDVFGRDDIKFEKV